MGIHMGHAVMWPVADTVTIGIPLAAIIMMLVHRHRLLARGEAADRAQRDGRTGSGEVIVHGVVETDDDRPPLAVEIREQRHDGRGHPWWFEIDRKLSVRPFTVRTTHGERFTVEPDQKVVFVRPLGPPGPEDHHDQRVRQTALEPGESVYAVGALEGVAGAEGPYRGSGVSALRPPARGRMVVSTQSLRAHYELEAGYVAKKTIGLAFLITAAHLLLLWGYDGAQLEMLLSWHGPSSGLASTGLQAVRVVSLIVCAVAVNSTFWATRPWYWGKIKYDWDRGT